MLKNLPERRCVGCREMIAKPKLVRIVVAQEEAIFLDPTGKANGRGAYLCKSTDCLQKALKSKGLERSLKRSIPQQIYQELEQSLHER